jgi:hypothetical protein
VHTVAVALQQRQPELAFQRLDAGAERRLRQAQQRRGGGQAAFADGRLQVAQPAQVQSMGRGLGARPVTGGGGFGHLAN